MNASLTARRGWLRIVGAIAAKDVADALHNKILLTIVLGTALLVLSNQALPLLLSQTPALIVHDAGRSLLIPELKRADDLQLGLARTPEELERAVAEDLGLVLGVVLPAGLDQAMAAGEPVTLRGYIAHHVGQADADRLRARYEAQLAGLAGGPLHIDLAGGRVYPAVDAGGRPALSALWLVVTVLIVGCAVVPLLIGEERDSHTLDALLVSPATLGQVVAGKATAGLLFGLVAGTVVLVLNARSIVHWPAAAAAVLAGALLAVAVGLLLGSLFTNLQSLNLWLSVALGVLLGPVVLDALQPPGIPAALRALIAWLPGAPLARAARAALAGSISPGRVAIDLAAVAAWAALLLAVVLWRLRRLDR